MNSNLSAQTLKAGNNKIMLSSSNTNNSLLDSATYYNTNNTSSNTNTNIDSGTLLRNKKESVLPLPLGKTKTASLCIGTAMEDSEVTRL
jgi:hypothetical protein